MLIKILQGIFIGIAFILPGLSAGTVMLIIGLYRTVVDDLAALRLRPYLPLLAGIAFGAFTGIFAIGYLLENYHQPITAFLMGLLLASIPAVIRNNSQPVLRFWPLCFAVTGFLVTWFVICEPTRTFTVLPPGGFFHFFLGGTLASATMLLPGVSGSSVLIIMNLYDQVIEAFSSWQWLKLAFFSAGFLVGLFGLARLLSALFRRYRLLVSLLLAGLILGSTRALLPIDINVLNIFLVFAGAAPVIYLTVRK